MIVYYEVYIDQNHNRNYCNFRVISEDEYVVLLKRFEQQRVVKGMGCYSESIEKDGVFYYKWYVDMDKLDEINLNKETRGYIDKNIRRVKLDSILTGQKF